MDLSTLAKAEPASSPRKQSVRSLYFSLLSDELDSSVRGAAQQFLCDELERAAALDIDLPAQTDELHRDLSQRAARMGEAYRCYLVERRKGASRRFFRSRAHALFFLRAVAPTKLVDGAWLSGLLPQWHDTRLTQLINTYLEELGDGLPGQNHVAIYRHLLAREGCEQWQDLPDERYRQGTVQLALGLLAEHFLPELIGYNLSYEQPPLHLLITAYELEELGIDPYYFTLHATIDNAAGGHASRAVDGALATLPRLTDRQAFLRRMRNGFRLSEAGPGSMDAIADYNPQREVERILRGKCAVGQGAHSDRCRIDGRTVNEWLANPEQIGEFLTTLQARGWIKRNTDPAASRFWQLLQGDGARMFGVFDRYQLTIIADWIRNDATATEPAARPSTPPLRDLGGIRNRRPECLAVNDFNHDQQQLRSRLGGATSLSAAMGLLIPLISPIHHHTPLGLLATRYYVQLFRYGSLNHLGGEAIDVSHPLH